MYKTTFNKTTRKSTYSWTPNQEIGICKICGKKFIPYESAKFNIEYCNMHWNKNRKVKKIRIRTNTDKKKCETWQSLLKEDWNPPEYGIKIYYGRNRN